MHGLHSIPPNHVFPAAFARKRRAKEHWVCVLDCAPQRVAAELVAAVVLCTCSVSPHFPTSHIVIRYMRSLKNTLKQVSAQHLVRDVVSKTDEVGILTSEPEQRTERVGLQHRDGKMKFFALKKIRVFQYPALRLTENGANLCHDFRNWPSSELFSVSLSVLTL